MASKLQKKLMEQLKAIPDVFAMKLEGNGMTCIGMPDIMILCKTGRTIFAEIKEPGDRVRPDQAIRFLNLKGIGFPIYIVRNNDDINSVMEEVKQWTL